MLFTKAVPAVYLISNAINFFITMQMQVRVFVGTFRMLASQPEHTLRCIPICFQQMTASWKKMHPLKLAREDESGEACSFLQSNAVSCERGPVVVFLDIPFPAANSHASLGCRWTLHSSVMFLTIESALSSRIQYMGRVTFDFCLLCCRNARPSRCHRHRYGSRLSGLLVRGRFPVSPPRMASTLWSEIYIG